MKPPYPNRIRELRIRSRLTRKELGKLIDRSPFTVARHESGERSIDQRDVRDYARVFKCTVHELFTEPNAPPKPYTGP